MSARNGNGHVVEGAHFWIGRLSRSTTLALADMRDKRPYVAREHLNATIRDFLRSPIVSDELRQRLRGDLRRR